jgi:hypothetical protein
MARLAIATGTRRTTSQTSQLNINGSAQQPENHRQTRSPTSEKETRRLHSGPQGKTQNGCGRVDRTELAHPAVGLTLWQSELDEVNQHPQTASSNS